MNKTKNPVPPSVSNAGLEPSVVPQRNGQQTVVSPDMKQTLVLKEKEGGEGVMHTFSTYSEENDNPKIIFNKAVDLPHRITVPFNTWSPGNKYLFLKESSSDKDSYIVLTSSGNPLTKTLQSVVIEELFAEKFPEYKITEVTGWAGPALIIVNTDNQDGTQGPSFWFDVSTLSFIKLSTRFN